MNTLALRNYKASLTMTHRQEQILTGMLLGDAHLERQRGSVAERLKIEHFVGTIGLRRLEIQRVA